MNDSGTTTKPAHRPPGLVLDALAPVFGRIAAAGGRAIVTGGFVRDVLLGRAPVDLDVEVQGLPYPRLVAVLEELGPVDTQGAAFGIAEHAGVEWALPRRERSTGPGHRDFEIELVPELPFAESVRRRDFTSGAIGLDAHTGLLLDPQGGIADLHRRVLRPVAPERWAEDPLRALRAMQLLARLEFAPAPELLELAPGVALEALSAERVGAQWDKLLLAAPRPAQGLQFLADTGLLRAYPELAALRGCPQDPLWHPEGDVWTHTLLVVDAAARLRTGEPDTDARLLYGALCHDLGKPVTTVVSDDGVRSPGHEPLGEAPARSFLARLAKASVFVDGIVALVRHHLAPAQFAGATPPASPKAYRRLARTLETAGTSLDELARLARADSLGRTTADALRAEFPLLDAFVAEAERLQSLQAPPPDVVQGRHLIARGLDPGPVFRVILARCRELQDDEGLDDPATILDRVLGPDA